MSPTITHAVTGAFGFTGRYIAMELMNRGVKVRTLTNSGPGKLLPDKPWEQFPLDFNDRQLLCKALTGVTVLFNSHWVRFN